MFLAFALTKDLLILKPILVACLTSFVIARLFHPHSIYERQMGMELDAEDRREARLERKDDIQHTKMGSLRRRTFIAPPPPTTSSTKQLEQEDDDQQPSTNP